MMSVFFRNPEFQGQTKERLSSADAQRLVESALRDPFDHWLAGQPQAADALLAFVVDRAEERLKRRKEKEVARARGPQAAPARQARRLLRRRGGRRRALHRRGRFGRRLGQAGARPRTQAILPLRGKILNVASASLDKLRAKQELADLLLALGFGTGARYREEVCATSASSS